MIRRIILLLLHSLLVFTSVTVMADRDVTSRTLVAFMDVNIIPMDSSRVLTGYTVIVQGDRIMQLGRKDEVRASAEAFVVRASGRYLMPGIAEMHGHLPDVGPPAGSVESVLFLYLANGVTTVRGMKGSPGQLELRERVNRGEIVAPTLYLAGPGLGDWIRSADEALKWIKVSGVVFQGNGFFYSRYDSPEPGHELFSKNENHKVYFHRLGTPQSDDDLVYADPAHPQRLHIVGTTHDKRFAILVISEPGQGKKGNALYVRDLSAGEKTFTPLIAEIGNDTFNVVDNVGDKLLLKTNKGAPNNKVVLCDPKNPDEKNWKVVLPEEPEPLQSVGTGLRGDALAIEYRDGGESHRFEITPGQVDWDEPSDRIHRGVNVGKQPYEEITVFFLDRPDAVPQPCVGYGGAGAESGDRTD